MDRREDFQEKIDALDLIINVLREHEKRLDEVAEDLERILSRIQPPAVEPKAKELVEVRPPAKVFCVEWSDFKEVSRNPDLVTFEVDEKGLKVNSISRSAMYQYSEPISEAKIRLKRDNNNYRVESKDIEDLLDKMRQKELKCGLESSVYAEMVRLLNGLDILVFRFYPDLNKIKPWLSNELSVPLERIVRGKIDA